MNKIKVFFQKYWLFIILAAAVTILTSFYFFQRNLIQEKKKNLISLIPPEIKTYSSNIPNLTVLEKDFPDFPKEIEVYQVGNNFISDQQALKISQNFGYQENPIVTNDINGPIYSWSNEFNNLSIYLKEGKFQYALDLLRNPELINGEPPNFQESENKLNELLKERELIPMEKIKLKIIEKNYYLIGASNFIKTIPSDPQKSLTFLNSIYEINSFKIEGPETPFISIYFTNNFQIARFDYSKIFENINTLDKYPLKTKSELLKSIKENPQISYLKNSESFYQENLIIGEKIPNLKSLSFEKIELIYYKEIKPQSYLQPVFLITGEAILGDGTQAEVGVYLPAIKDEYLLK